MRGFFVLCVWTKTRHFFLVKTFLKINLPIPLSVAKNGGAIRLVFKIPFPIEKKKYNITNAVDYLQYKTICYSLLPDEHNMI